MVTVSPNLIKRQKQHFNVLANLGLLTLLIQRFRACSCSIEVPECAV